MEPSEAPAKRRKVDSSLPHGGYFVLSQIRTRHFPTINIELLFLNGQPKVICSNAVGQRINLTPHGDWKYSDDGEKLTIWFHHGNVDRLKKKHEFHHIPNTETFVLVRDNPEFDRILARDVSLSGPRRSVVVKSEETYDL